MAPDSYLVEFEHPELDLLVLVLLLLGLGVGLLLTLLTATQQTSQDVQGLLLLQPSKAQQLTISQWLAIEDGIHVLGTHTCGTAQTKLVTDSSCAVQLSQRIARGDYGTCNIAHSPNIVR